MKIFALFFLLLSCLILLPSCIYNKKSPIALPIAAIPAQPRYVYGMNIKGVECEHCAKAAAQAIKTMHPHCAPNYSFNNETMYVNYSAYEPLDFQALVKLLEKEEFIIDTLKGPLRGNFCISDGARVFLDTTGTKFFVANQQNIPLSIDDNAWGLLPRTTTIIAAFVWFDIGSKAYWLSLEPETNRCNAG